MNSKVKPQHKFFSSLDGVKFSSPRYFEIPTDSFFELILTPQQTAKMRQWMKDGDKLIYLWNLPNKGRFRLWWVNETKREQLSKVEKLNE